MTKVSGFSQFLRNFDKKKSPIMIINAAELAAFAQQADLTGYNGVDLPARLYALD